MKQLLTMCALVGGLISASADTILPGLMQYYFVVPNNSQVPEMRYEKDLSDADVTDGVLALGVAAADSVSDKFVNAVDGLTYGWNNYGCYAYEGEIYVESGVTYSFCAAFDDGAAVWIDGTKVVENNNGWGSSGVVGAYTPEETGWKSFRGFVWDFTGGKAKSSNVLCGIQWTDSTDSAAIGNTGLRKDSSLWKPVMDGGDGSFLRVRLPDVEERQLTIVVESDAVAHGVSPAPGTSQYRTVLPIQRANCSAEAMVKVGAYFAWVLKGYALQTSQDDGATWSVPVTNLTTAAYLYTPECGVDEKLTWIYEYTDLRPVFTASGTVNFEDASRWSTGVVPADSQKTDVVVEISGDTVIHMQSLHRYRDIHLVGEGHVSFTGESLVGIEFFVEEGVTYQPRVADIGPVNFRDGSVLQYSLTESASAARYLVQGGATLQVDVDLVNGTSPKFILQPSETKPVVIAGEGSVRGLNGNDRLCVDAGMINPNGLVRNQELVLVVNETGSDFEANDFTGGNTGLALGSRFSGSRVEATQVVGTVVDGKPVNAYHYDFEGTETPRKNAKGSMVATDSSGIVGIDGYNNAVFGPSLEGQAVLLSSSTFAPQHYSQGLMPNGCATFTTYVRPIATDKRIFWSMGPGDVPPVYALVVDDESTLSFVMAKKMVNDSRFFAYGINPGWNADTEWITLASVRDIPELTAKEHFVAVTLSAYGTTMRVDNQKVETDVVWQPIFSTSGQFSAVRMGCPSGYSSQPATNGAWMGDWQLYGAVLTDVEIGSIWSALDRSQLPVLPAYGTVSFEDAWRWNVGYVPNGGEIKVVAYGDAVVQLPTDREVVRIYIEGTGSVEFVGGTMTADEVVVAEGATFKASGSGFNIITVEDGGACDVAGLALGADTELRVSGSGVAGTGAVFSTKACDRASAPSVRSVRLQGDAVVRADAGKPWGIVAPAGKSASLLLNAYDVSKVGAGDLFVDGVSSVTSGRMDITAGSLTLDDASFATMKEHSGTRYVNLVVRDGCTLNYNNEQALTGAKFFLQGGSTLNLSVALNTSISPVFMLQATEAKPVTFTGTGSVAGINQNDRLMVDASMLDHSKLGAESEVTLVESTLPTTLQADDFTSVLGSRFTEAIVQTDKVVTTKVRKVANRYHYDFEGAEEPWANERGKAAALDSVLLAPGWDPARSTAEFGPAQGGQAVMLSDSNFAPIWYDWGSKTHNFVAGAATIVTVMQPMVTDKRIVWSMGPGDDMPCFFLAVEDDSTIALVQYEYPTTAKAKAKTELARVSGIPNLTSKFHFVVMTFDGRGTTLQVDDLRNSTENLVRIPRSNSSQIGGLRGTYGWSTDGYSNQPNTNGCWLDDWQVFDTTLTKEELESVRAQFWPRATVILMK